MPKLKPKLTPTPALTTTPMLIHVGTTARDYMCFRITNNCNATCQVLQHDRHKFCHVICWLGTE